jgi:protein subunit release factor A
MDESDFKIDPKDLRIDTFHSSGHGDQRVTAADSAVRITHVPTNTVVFCNGEKDRLKEPREGNGSSASQAQAAALASNSRISASVHT